jgi:diguanylate cyclase (GGDEF)-like protein
MYPFSILDPGTLMLIAIGVFLVTGLFMALAHRIRGERAYVWLSAGSLAFAVGWALQLAQSVIGVNLVTIPLSSVFLLLLPVMLICASLEFLRLQGIGFALIIATPILVTLFFVLRLTMHHSVIPGALTASLNGAMYLGTAWIFNRYAHPRNALASAIIGANVVIGAVFILRTGVLLYATMLPAGIPAALIDQMVYTTLFVNLIFVLAQALCFPLLDFIRSETDLSRANRRLSHLADRDSLTGSYNRRAFTVRLEVELQFHKPNRLPLSVVLIDIDGFKAFNDRHGRGAGDAALVAIAEILESTSRGSATACRYGDDEFALLLPETEIEQAIALAESIRAAIRAAAPRAEHGQLPNVITCSFGVAALSRETDTQHAIMSAADLALYEAKREGGDRVCPPAGTLGDEQRTDDTDGARAPAADLSRVVTRLYPEREEPN